jgi:hypothetical protein
VTASIFAPTSHFFQKISSGQAILANRSGYNGLMEIDLDARRRGRMDRSRKANRQGHEITLQYKTRQESLDEEELSEERLTQLLAFVSQHEQTSAGAAELERRKKLFGECKRNEGETSVQFYARLRHWLDREIPPTKLPLHAPRQTGN